MLRNSISVTPIGIYIYIYQTMEFLDYENLVEQKFLDSNPVLNVLPRVWWGLRRGVPHWKLAWAAWLQGPAVKVSGGFGQCSSRPEDKDCFWRPVHQDNQVEIKVDEQYLCKSQTTWRLFIGYLVHQGESLKNSYTENVDNTYVKHIHMCIYVHSCVYMSVCRCTCVYIYIYANT